MILERTRTLQLGYIGYGRIVTPSHGAHDRILSVLLKNGQLDPFPMTALILVQQMIMRTHRCWNGRENIPCISSGIGVFFLGCGLLQQLASLFPCPVKRCREKYILSSRKLVYLGAGVLMKYLVRAQKPQGNGTLTAQTNDCYHWWIGNPIEVLTEMVSVSGVAGIGFLVIDLPYIELAVRVLMTSSEHLSA